MWGQTDGYSGIWYIASEIDSYDDEKNHYGSNNSTTATHCYLVPAEYDSASELAYYTAGNAGKTKPYLTTFKTNQDLNSIWILKKTEDNYYYIIHALTGKYLVYAIPTTSQNAAQTRRVVHLEASPNLNDVNTKFAVTYSNNCYYFSPYALSGLEDSDNKFLNVCTQNRKQYYARNNKDNSDGLIGVYNDTDNGHVYLSRWHLEDASSSTDLIPTISDLDEETNIFTITSPAAAFSSFCYTTDGNTTPTSSVGTPSDGTSISPTTTWQVQAVGVFGNFVTPVAGPKTITPIIPVTPTISYNNTTGEVTIFSAEGTTIYYTVSTSGTEPDDPTSSLYDGTGSNSITISGVTTPTIYKAIATKSGFPDSEVATQSIEKLVSPSLSFDDATQKVSITTNSTVEEVANVYTIDGNDPTPSSTEYSEPISLTGTTTVMAMTVKEGYINSDPVSLAITKLASSPSISVSGSTVTLEYTEDSEATIYYTTDGMTPTLQSSSYTDPFSLDGDQNYTVKAIATKTGFLNSDVAEKMVDNRTSISAPTITYTGNTVTITASDPSDVIYYTTDGSTPTTSTETHFTSSGTFDLVYGSIYTIKAIASNGDITSSEVTETIDLTDFGYTGIYYFQNNGNGGEYYMYPVGGTSALVKTAKKTDQDAIWKIEIVGDYYRIIHYKDGKYLVAKDVVDGTMPDTETVSLVQTDSPGENALFEITRESGDESDILQQILLIRPKAAANADGHIYLNTRSGNNGTNKIGLWDASGSSLWKLARVPAKPTITVNDINVTISSDLDKVYYTIDGTTPTSSSTQGKNVTLAYGPSYTVKAICIYHDNISNTDWTSGVATSNTIKVDLLNPIFTRSGNNVNITNSQASGVTFRYTFSDDGTDPVNPVPGGAGTNYESALPLTANARNVFKAIAYNVVGETTYTSDVITFIVNLRDAVVVSSLAGITSATGSYKLASGFSATGTPKEGDVEIGTSTNPFKGTIDGNLVEFELNSPLFDYVQDATIKNVIISKATINTSGNAGAIANNALGYTRIYNCGVLATGSTVEKDNDGYDHISSCSSTIKGTGYVGGIVGFLDGYSRVINCFSYANVSGGSHVGGIVGYNNVATTAGNLKTMVMNCMFYGEVSGSSIAPIYNGAMITNDGDANGVNNFNFFRLESSYIKDRTITKVYNCALGAETRFLQRFEFFRHLLNSNRELAAWWATGNAANKNEMMKWVLEPSQIGSPKPYPILKDPGYYASVVNYTPSTTTYDEANRNKGYKLTSEGDGGVLHVTISMGSGGAHFSAPSGAGFKSGVASSFDLTITDKDYEHYNFNYGKVQLPYYNDYCDGNYTGNRVVTGWKITSITGGTAGSYSTGADDVTFTNGELTATPYNFADRKCKNKDLYSVSNRVFNQGAYWDVPEGVTAITIEPYWGKAVYLSDAYWDVTYKNSSADAMATAANVTTVGGGQHYENGVSTFNGQTVFTSMSNAIASSGTALYSGTSGTASHTVYDYAVVLVGNYHHTASIEADSKKPYTVTSVDLDGDNEPDYSLMLRFNSRIGFHPVRYDFLNLIGLGMAQKTTGGTGSYNLGIMQPKYWFEVTNTALFRVTQFEYSPSGRAKKPIILQGGVIEQWVTQQQDAGDLVEYFHVGGNVWFKEFHRGSHQDNTGKSTPHPPVSVTGGDFDKFYLTGLYQAEAATYDDNAECYINGGRFGIVAGTGMEGLGSTEGKGNITWQIDNADITEFYGGGINAKKPAIGNITTFISNSHVDRFCGGPKFGDMTSGKTVITTATGCTFGTYFGAGYGGNSYRRYAPTNQNDVMNANPGWNSWISTEYKQEYNSAYKDVSTEFGYQFIPQSGNTKNVARLFVEFVSFSLATTYDVSSKLTSCTINENFYGGGSLGKVEGPVTSILTDCTVKGNVFGAGYSASTPTVELMPKSGFIDEPYYYEDLGTFKNGVIPSKETSPSTTTYQWEHATTVNSTATAINTTDQILYTEVDLSKSNLGSVSGAVTLTLTGNTRVGTMLQTVNQETNETVSSLKDGTGNVYGGGDSSYVYNKTTPSNASTVVNLAGNTEVFGNVFGGGNNGEVSGSATVNIKQNVE